MPLNNVVTGFTTKVDANGVPLFYSQEAVGNQYAAATQSAQTFGVGLSATVATFGLYNPVGSGVNAYLKVLNLSLSAPPAAAVVFYYAFTPVNVANPSAVTALAAVPTLLNNPTAAVCVPFRAATLSAVPTIIRLHQSSLAAALQSQSIFEDQINGKIILPPGAAIALQASAAAAGFISAVWEELQA